jgi:hypothetical protein
MATRKKSPSAKSAPIRFVKLDAQSNELQIDAKDWVQVLDKQTNLIWPREASEDRKSFKDAKAYAESLKLAGAFWRLPTITELLTLVDYGRCDPAIDTDFFTCKPNFHWTSTPAAYAPSGCAWLVDFDDGSSYWNFHNSEFFVRPVRSAGQQLALGAL